MKEKKDTVYALKEFTNIHKTIRTQLSVKVGRKNYKNYGSSEEFISNSSF